MSVSVALRATFSTTGNIKCSSLSARDITASSNAPYEQKENECSHHWLEDVQTTPEPSIEFMQDGPPAHTASVYCKPRMVLEKPCPRKKECPSSNSPDFNPNEYYWGIVNEKGVQHRSPCEFGSLVSMPERL